MTSCWAIVGAAAFVSLMYWSGVYSGEAKNHYYMPWNLITFEVASPEVQARMLRPPDSSGTVRILGAVVYDSYEPIDEAQQVVDRWTAATAIVLGLIGAAIAVIFSRIWHRPRPSPSVDLWLWVAVTSLLFVLLVRVGLPGEQRNLYKAVEFNLELYRGGFGRFDWSDVLRFFRAAIRIWVPAALVGWALHVILVNFDIRIRRRVPDQAADYDDRIKPTPEPPAG